MKRFINNFQSRRLLTHGPRPSPLRSSPFALRPSPSAFTLIEVVMAVAVVAIGLTAVLGLLPGAIQSGRNAADNTLAATLAEDAFSGMRRDVLAMPIGTWPPTWNASVATDWDAAGGNPSSAADNYFLVTLTWTQSPSMPNSGLIVTATVAWPANATANQSKSVFVTEIARYNQ